MSRELTNRLKTWRLTKDDVYKSITADRRRLNIVKKLLDEFVPFLCKYKSEINIGYEIDGVEDCYVSVIFRDLNLSAYKVPRSNTHTRVMHLRLSQSIDGVFNYYMEYVDGGRTATVTSTEVIKTGKEISDLKKAVADNFREIEVYTEDESICRDIIE